MITRIYSVNPSSKVIYLLICSPLTHTYCKTIPYLLPGAIFNEQHKNSSVETAFKYAIHRINADKTILPQSRLDYEIRYVSKDDSFHATKEGESSSPTLTTPLPLLTQSDYIVLPIQGH